MYIVALCCRKGRPIEPPPRSLIEILDDAARRRPDAPALVGTRERLSYGELLRRVRRVAERIASGAPDARAVAVMASQTPTGIAAALGCAASGRVCIPLNPADPVARRAVILEGASPDAIVVESEAALAGLTLAPGARILMLDDGDAAADAVFPPIDPDAPAFVHYTSGSSGRPKGVVVSWRSAMRRAAVDGLELAASDALLAASGPSISSGMAFVLAGLSVGARLLVVSLAAEGAGAFLRLAQRGSASTFAGSPAILASLSRLPDSRDAFARVRWVRTGSMALPTADLAVIRAMLPPGCNICHTYASTEAMILAMWTIPPDYRCDESALPVGPLADDVAWRLVDSAGRDAPHGEIGELVVSGRFIALGEWERGRLVPGRMPPDPERPGWRVFRTGDLMRIGVDGMLRFSSRVDRQINIHGVRIEPAEIEGVLRAEAGVTDAVALATPIEARVSLDAFVAAPGLDADALREALRARMRKALPTTMRPSRLWVMEALPRLPGGKIDIGALRRLAADGQRNG